MDNLVQTALSKLVSDAIAQNSDALEQILNIDDLSDAPTKEYCLRLATRVINFSVNLSVSLCMEILENAKVLQPVEEQALRKIVLQSLEPSHD